MLSAGRVVVTGGAGFVGRSVVRAFLERGTPVTTVDRRDLPESVRAAAARWKSMILAVPMIMLPGHRSSGSPEFDSPFFVMIPPR